MFDLRRFLSITAIVAVSLLSCATTYAVAASFPTNCVGCNFSHDDLHGQDFTGAVWIGTNLAQANLRGAKLQNARLVGANFRGADLRDADFSGANCIGCNFAGAQLAGTHFDGAHLTGSNFNGDSFAELSDAALRTLLDRCIGCNLSGSDVHGHDLHGIRLIGISFRNANANAVNFSGSAMCWYNHDDSRVEPRCDAFEGAQVRGADFRGVTLCQTHDDTTLDCRPVDAATLKRLSESDLAGAILP